MKVPLIDFGPQTEDTKEPVAASVAEVLGSLNFILGPKVKELEDQIAKSVAADHGVGVASGSDALYLALLALGVGEGDEVITTPFTFFASGGSIARAGAKPVFADVDADTFNIDPSSVQSLLSEKTKAIMPVHLFGLPADMVRIKQIADTKELKVIEDAAQAIGARYENRPLGTLSDAVCYSFFPTKNLGGAGDGGMVTTSDLSAAEAIRSLRKHGSKQKYIHDTVGINSRLDEIQAGILLAKYPYLNKWNIQRHDAATYYKEQLRSLPLSFQPESPGVTHVYHLFSVTCRTKVQRDGLAAHLRANSIESAVYYPTPLHLQKAFAYLGYKRGDLPVAEKLSDTILSLPLYPGITRVQQDAVIREIKIYFE